jgi:translation initiation factor 3 subunit L
VVHIAESTVGRRYAGWFIKNTERAQRVLDDLRNSPLPAAPAAAQAEGKSTSGASKSGGVPSRTGQKVAWGGVKVTS